MISRRCYAEYLKIMCPALMIISNDLIKANYICELTFRALRARENCFNIRSSLSSSDVQTIGLPTPFTPPPFLFNRIETCWIEVETVCPPPPSPKLQRSTEFNKIERLLKQMLNPFARAWTSWKFWLETAGSFKQPILSYRVINSWLTGVGWNRECVVCSFECDNCKVSLNEK